MSSDSCSFQKCPILVGCLGSSLPQQFIAQCSGCGRYFFTNGFHFGEEPATAVDYWFIGCRRFINSGYMCRVCWIKRCNST